MTRSLVIVATRGHTDSAQRLLEPEFRGVIQALHDAISDIDFSHWSDTPALAQRIHSQLRPAIDAMDDGFRQLRERQATATFSDRDVEHLLHTMWCIHAINESFADQGLEAN